MKTPTKPKPKAALKRMSAEDIRTLRNRLGLNQSQFWVAHRRDPVGWLALRVRAQSSPTGADAAESGLRQR